MRIIFLGIICSLIWVFLWRSWDNTVYQSHYSLQNTQTNNQVSQKIEFIWDAALVIHPHTEDFILKIIHASKKEIKIATYMFTLPGLREALLDAKKRGVDVQIILEKSPYNATSINRETVDFCKKNAISVHETEQDAFSFMHAKYMIFDDTWMISTANWTRSSFSSNREFSLLGHDQKILQTLRSRFQADFSSFPWDITPSPTLLVWPTSARETLVQFIGSTQGVLRIYMPNITDEVLIKEFEKLCQQRKTIMILLDKNDENEKNGNTLEKNGCPDVRLMKSPSLHGKVTIVDDTTGFVGSFNFTKNSLENNREVGIFIYWTIIDDIVNIFQKDWGKSIDF